MAGEFESEKKFEPVFVKLDQPVNKWAWQFMVFLDEQA